MLNTDDCYAILHHRDAGADGCFFVAVKTTGIYCRPICPARVPLKRNIVFYQHAAEAHAAGFRPCLRCRPESAPDSPAWMGSLASINRALILIDEGALVEGNVEELAGRLGMTARHLRRLFNKHLGIGPAAVEQTRRLHLAKKLVHETSLSMTDIAFAAGYGSVRRFNETFADLYGRPPSALRRRRTITPSGSGITVSLVRSADIVWQDCLERARERGAVIAGDRLHARVKIDGETICYTLAPVTRAMLELHLGDVPVRVLGKAIVRIKRTHLSAWKETGGTL